MGCALCETCGCGMIATLRERIAKALALMDCVDQFQGEEPIRAALEGES